MRTVYVVVVDRSGASDVDYWMSATTATENRNRALSAGCKVYAFTVKVATIIGLEARLMLAAEYWSLFDGCPEPVELNALPALA